MLSFSYSNLRRFLRIVPICPKPKEIGLENIPKDSPIIYVYNHIIRRGEPVYLGMAAPGKPNIRFFAEITLGNSKYLPILKRDIGDAIFSKGFQKTVKKYRWTGLCYAKLIEFLAQYVISQINRLDVVLVDIAEPESEGEKISKFKTNRQALKKSFVILENNIPLAIAPSGGSTYEAIENPVYQTIVPTLASWFYKQGKVIKIVPSVIKERPVITQRTYWDYVVDRIFVYKAIRWLMDLIKIKNYKKPVLTVEFLPPLTFEIANPSKSEKVDFVRNLQQLIFNRIKN
jgi:hypothetical protein